MDQPAHVDSAFEQLQAALGDDMARVNALIRTRMASEHAPRIPEVTAHLVEAGGKRLRPLLTLAAARVCGYEGDHHLRLAATVEFIHTATLLHDDVVDESARRRGRPTANLLWDNKSSVLVGDYLFARAFQLMVETDEIRVLDILANASAVIAEGEVLQLTAAANLATSEATYLQVVRGKTAALFAAATEVGARDRRAPEAEVRALARLRRRAGARASRSPTTCSTTAALSAALGKNAGDDFRERKMTLPVIRALAAASPAERRFWARVIGKGEQHPGDLEEALALMARHRALESSHATALEHAARARAALAPLPERPLKAMLAALAEFVVARLA